MGMHKLMCTMECMDNRGKLLTGKKKDKSPENYAKREMSDTRLQIIYHHFMWNSTKIKLKEQNTCQCLPGSRVREHFTLKVCEKTYVNENILYHDRGGLYSC